MRRTRSDMVTILVNRRNFLIKRMKEYKESNRTCGSYDVQEAAALEWVLFEFVLMTEDCSDDEEWIERLNRIVPMDDFEKSLDHKRQKEQERKNLSYLRKTINGNNSA